MNCKRHCCSLAVAHRRWHWEYCSLLPRYQWKMNAEAVYIWQFFMARVLYDTRVYMAYFFSVMRCMTLFETTNGTLLDGTQSIEHTVYGKQPLNSRTQHVICITEGLGHHGVIAHETDAEQAIISLHQHRTKQSYTSSSGSQSSSQIQHHCYHITTWNPWNLSFRLILLFHEKTLSDISR